MSRDIWARIHGCKKLPVLRETPSKLTSSNRNKYRAIQPNQTRQPRMVANPRSPSIPHDLCASPRINQIMAYPPVVTSHVVNMYEREEAFPIAKHHRSFVQSERSGRSNRSRARGT